MMNSKSAGSSTKIRLIEPYPYRFTVRCGSRDGGKTVGSVLHERMPGRPMERWQNLAEAGRICLNTFPVRPDQSVTRGDEITIDVPRVVEPAVPDDVRIVDESADYLAAYKPAPMPVHRGGRYHHNSLQAILEARTGRRLKIIHRLDVVTTGLVLFGKTKGFTAYAQRAFAQEQAEKHYEAMVAGEPGWEQTECSLAVRRNKGIRFTADQSGEGKPARTVFQVLEKNGDTAKVRAQPVTGRTHQIRVHLQALGHPVVDDPLYGPHPPESGTPGSLNRPISLCHIRLKLDDRLSWEI